MGRADYHGYTEQRLAAYKRLRDAQALLAEEDSQHWRDKKGNHARGAMYLAGYAVECQLKAIAMRVYRCRNLSDLAVKWEVDEREVYTHGLAAIAKRLPLWHMLRDSIIWPDFAAVMRWRPAWRYDPQNWANQKAYEFLDSVQRVYYWLERNH